MSITDVTFRVANVPEALQKLAELERNCSHLTAQHKSRNASMVGDSGGSGNGSASSGDNVDISDDDGSGIGDRGWDLS